MTQNHRYRAPMLFLYLILASSVTSAQSALPCFFGDLIGAGYFAGWDTAISLTNVSGREQQLLVSNVPPGGGACAGSPSTCYSIFDLTLPANGTTRLLASQVTGPVYQGLPYLVVSRLDQSDTSVPAVSAVVFQTAHPSIRASLPTCSSAVGASNDSATLVFTGAARGPNTHTNLIVCEVTGTSGVTYRVEALDATGSIIGSTTHEVDFDVCDFLGDVLKGLGIDALDHGSLRVTAVAGAESIRAVMTVLDTTNGVIAVEGRSP